jgi:hypothetical protein
MNELWINDQIRLPDGRVGTICYNGLDGLGIKFGLHDIPLEDLEGTSGGCFNDRLPLNHPSRKWESEAMLRDVKIQKYFSIPCVGEEFKIIRKCKDGNYEMEENY